MRERDAEANDSSILLWFQNVSEPLYEFYLLFICTFDFPTRIILKRETNNLIRSAQYKI